MKRFVIAVALCLPAVSAMAAGQQPTPAPAAATQANAPAAIPQQTHDDIIAMLQIVFADKGSEFTEAAAGGFMNQLLKAHPEITPEVAAQLRQAVTDVIKDPQTMKGLQESMVPAYAKAYSDDEIRQILAFGKTPAGAKILAGAPGKVAILNAMRPWLITTLVPKIYLQTAAILQKNGISLDAPGS